MNVNSTTVNKPFLPARPASWLACFGLLGVSVFLVHEGLDHKYSPSVAAVLAFAFCCLAWLNWQAVARIEESNTANDKVRRRAILSLSLVMAAGEAWLTHHGFLSLAANDGASLSIATAWAFAVGLAGFNLWAKYGFVSPIKPSGYEPGPGVDVAPADWADDPRVLSFSKRLALTEAADTRDALRMARSPAPAPQPKPRRKKAA